MIRGVRDVYVNVADMDRAVAFYTEVLGLSATERSPHWTTLDCGGLRFGLHWTGGDPVPAVPGDAHGPHAGGVITLEVADIEAALAALAAAGVEVRGGIARNPWGALLVFEDPDGNVLKLMEPPA